MRNKIIYIIAQRFNSYPKGQEYGQKLFHWFMPYGEAAGYTIILKPNKDSTNNIELQHVKLEVTPEQFNTLLNFYPEAIKNDKRDNITLIAYWHGKEYGVVHVTVNNPQ